MKNYLSTAIKEQRLPTEFASTIEDWYQPVARSIAEKSLSAHHGETMILGIQGSQGSGKSTFAYFLKLLLENEHSLRVEALSLDDFYLTYNERCELSESIHPLLKTRGVPGTHDVELAQKTIKKLSKLSSGEITKIPRFNKAMDDRAEENDWDTVTGPIDIIIFEGWCVGVPPQEEEELTSAINELEELEDSTGEWRRYVNQKLEEEYIELFDGMDALLVLQAPSFEVVYSWRSLQEEKLADKMKNNPELAARIQSPEQLKRFISHYERLTRHCISKLPEKADWLLFLDADHRIIGGNTAPGKF